MKKSSRFDRKIAIASLDEFGSDCILNVQLSRSVDTYVYVCDGDHAAQRDVLSRWNLEPINK